MSNLRYDDKAQKCFTEDEFIDFWLPQLPNVDLLKDQFKTLPTVTIGYDSTADTLKHIKRVNQLLCDASIELLHRAKRHDDSKLVDPEKDTFDSMTPKLRDSRYGSDQYKRSLLEMSTALEHHYKNNSHHPEHYQNGVDDMDLYDLIEMFIDWKAATERHANGDLSKSLATNKERFKISDQLAAIFENHLQRYFQ